MKKMEMHLVIEMWVIVKLYQLQALFHLNFNLYIKSSMHQVMILKVCFLLVFFHLLEFNWQCYIMQWNYLLDMMHQSVLMQYLYHFLHCLIHHQSLFDQQVYILFLYHSSQLQDLLYFQNTTWFFLNWTLYTQWVLFLLVLMHLHQIKWCQITKWHQLWDLPKVMLCCPCHRWCCFHLKVKFFAYCCFYRIKWFYGCNIRQVPFYSMSFISFLWSWSFLAMTLFPQWNPCFLLLMLPI